MIHPSRARWHQDGREWCWLRAAPFLSPPDPPAQPISFAHLALTSSPLPPPLPPT